jgi:protein kinase
MKKKIYKWEECTKLQEIKALIKLSHPNIIQLLEIIKQNNELFFVFEYMSQNIYQLLKNSPLSEISIRNIIFQSLSGLCHMHQLGLFHRDLKPENILEFDSTIKLADFGLAKETN